MLSRAREPGGAVAVDEGEADRRRPRWHRRGEGPRGRRDSVPVVDGLLPARRRAVPLTATAAAVGLVVEATAPGRERRLCGVVRVRRCVAPVAGATAVGAAAVVQEATRGAGAVGRRSACVVEWAAASCGRRGPVRSALPRVAPTWRRRRRAAVGCAARGSAVRWGCATRRRTRRNTGSAAAQWRPRRVRRRCTAAAAAIGRLWWAAEAAAATSARVWVPALRRGRSSAVVARRRVGLLLLRWSEPRCPCLSAVRSAAAAAAAAARRRRPAPAARYVAAVAVGWPRRAVVVVRPRGRAAVVERVPGVEVIGSAVEVIGSAVEVIGSARHVVARAPRRRVRTRRRATGITEGARLQRRGGTRWRGPRRRRLRRRQIRGRRGRCRVGPGSARRLPVGAASNATTDAVRSCPGFPRPRYPRRPGVGAVATGAAAREAAEVV